MEYSPLVAFLMGLKSTHHLELEENQRTSMAKSQSMEFSYCRELRYGEVLRYLKTHGEFPDIPGLPRRPDPDAIGNPRKFRILFGKPWRLSHCHEAREVRNGLIQGVKSPARRYLERSKHPHLKNV
jgi:hypothetical protein